jgi:hypothetical protein
MRNVTILGGAALLALVGCSGSTDNGNKAGAQPTTPPAAPAPIATTPAAATPPADPAPAPAGDPAPSRSETKEYVVEIVPPAQVSAGAEATVTVKVTPKKADGWHFNLEFPTSVKSAGEGVAVANPDQKLKDAVSRSEEDGATWAVKVTPAKAGAGKLTCDLRFAVCTETTCDPKRATLALTLEAK